MNDRHADRPPLLATSPVGALMGPLLVSAPADLTIAAAAETMASHGIRHLPVCDGQHQLVGIVSDRDVRLAGFREPGQPDAAVLYPDAPVSQIMSRDVQTVAPDTTAAVAARRMLARRIGSLVVVSEGRPVGILSTRDLLKIVAAGGETSTGPPPAHSPVPPAG